MPAGTPASHAAFRLFLGQLATLAVMVVLLQSGCSSREPVRHYRIPTKEILYASNHVETADAKARVNTGSSGPAERMLGAIVPNGSQTWYFRMTGPIDAVATQETAFREFVESLQFENEQSAPQWELPESWQESPGSSQRRPALSVEVAGRKLDVSVIQMATDTSPDSLLGGVNRWRMLMQLPPITAEQLPQKTTTLELAGGTATLVNLVGNFQSGRGSPSLGQSADGRRANQGDVRIAYDKPAGWLEVPPPPFSQLAFQVSEGDAVALVTVSLLRGDAGGLLANVRRWQRQVGGPEVRENDLDELTEKLELQGIAGSYVEIKGDDSVRESESIFGWAGIRPGQSWFVKLRGNANLVHRQRDPFRSFLQSLRFDAMDGVDDGQ
jgi:hypothetical protein